jgi:tetratricopeptide (TPR) repeat protein
LPQPGIYLHWIYNIYDKITDIYLKYKNDYETALQNQLISHQYVTDNCKFHPRNSETNDSSMKTELAKSNEKLADIYIKLGKDSLAIEHLLVALKLNEEAILVNHYGERKNADIEMKLADIRLKLEDYQIAYNHFENALKIYRKIEQLSNESNNRESDDEEEEGNSDDENDTVDSDEDETESEIKKIEEKMNYIQNILMTNAHSSYQ